MKFKICKNLSKYIFFGYMLYAICYMLSGCVTLPTKETGPTYHLKGVTYIPLPVLCAAENITWEYDTFTRRVTLYKDAHKINLMAGEKLLLVDGQPHYLKFPVEIYQGTVAVPSKFKEQILDTLFKKDYPRRQVILSRIKKVVVDAGHGGKDPGTIGKTGLREKHVNLDIAKRLSNLLKAQGLQVVMTRTTDKFISLQRRVDIANNFKADLFISLHANANRVRSLSGFEVYYVSSQVSDSKRALKSASQDALDLDKACFCGEPSLNLKAILWDMIYTANRAESLRLAKYVCRAADNLNTRIIGTKGAPFYVLKGAHMPAVLIEVGFLSNYNEERLIKNGYYRQQLAEAIEQGIRNYIRDSTLTELVKQ